MLTSLSPRAPQAAPAGLRPGGAGRWDCWRRYWGRGPAATYVSGVSSGRREPLRRGRAGSGTVTRATGARSPDGRPWHSWERLLEPTTGLRTLQGARPYSWLRVSPSSKDPSRV